MTDIIATATLIATVAHKAVGQIRKYSGEDYVTHPLAVSRIVADYTDCKFTIAAAILHDVIEDTDITEEDLIAQLMLFHPTHEATLVVKLVMGVTKVSEQEDGVRKVRRALDHAHFAKGDSRQQLIKGADSLHNCLSIASGDAKFAKRYIPEKRELADMLTLAPTELINRLKGVLDAAEMTIHTLEEKGQA